MYIFICFGINNFSVLQKLLIADEHKFPRFCRNASRTCLIVRNRALCGERVFVRPCLHESRTNFSLANKMSLKQKKSPFEHRDRT